MYSIVLINEKEKCSCGRFVNSYEDAICLENKVRARLINAGQKDLLVLIVNDLNQVISFKPIRFESKTRNSRL